MSERKLVTIQTITDIQPIPGADAIDQARVQGWTVVVKKGEFQVGEPCVFFEIDSLLPAGPEWSEFMRPRGFRVKTIRLRGVLSQGLALPVSILPDHPILPDYADDRAYGIKECDLAAALGVTKYEPAIAGNPHEIAGHFPSLVPKTDEIRLQSCLGVLDEIKGQEFYVTTKCDGTSAIYLRTPDELVVCSRNWALKPGAGWQWRMVEKYNLAEVIPVDYAVQGEICGPGIQKNRLGLADLGLFVFNVWDVRGARYLNYDEFIRFCADRNLRTVPIEMTVSGSSAKDWQHSLDGPGGWLSAASGFYAGTKNRKEGIVVRPLIESRSETLGGRLSFKCINNDFLL